jgi:hypothetical protein
MLEEPMGRTPNIFLLNGVDQIFFFKKKKAFFFFFFFLEWGGGVGHGPNQSPLGLSLVGDALKGL